MPARSGPTLRSSSTATSSPAANPMTSPIFVKPSWGFWDEDVPTDETSRLSENHGQRVPTFGFVLFGGAVAGAQISHVRLANELVRRGYPVHAWWAMDWPRKSGLHPAISQRWLFSSSRYGGVTHVRS